MQLEINYTFWFRRSKYVSDSGDQNTIDKD